MHGEYKVHGGKLVVADLEVRDGAMTNIQIAGDFFLEPAEALDDICAALKGFRLTPLSRQSQRPSMANSTMMLP